MQPLRKLLISMRFSYPAGRTAATGCRNIASRAPTVVRIATM